MGAYKKMRKIIWIDVGTHFAQEYRSIFGNNLSFYFFLLKRFIGARILNRGKFVSLGELQKILSLRKEIRKNKEKFYSIFIEANPLIASKEKFYPEADMLFNIALTDKNQRPLSITKLYLGDGNEFSQGSSIFLEKHNVKSESFVTTLGISTKDFFKELEHFLSEKFANFDVILRLNCEGVEDEVIYAAHEHFQDRLKLICGSLKDVEGVKGQEAYDDLEKFIHSESLCFTKFYSGIYSWADGHSAILDVLKAHR